MAGTIQRQAINVGQGTRPAVGFDFQRISDTPSRLVFAATLAAVTALIFSLGSFWAIGERSDADREARSRAQQILIGEDIQSLLTEADAEATSGYLQGGLQNKASQDIVSNNLAKASALSAELGGRAGTVNADITRYARFVSTAQTNNRVGNPVGSTYQKQASNLLRGTILANLLKIDTANRKDMRDSLNKSSLLSRWLFLLTLPFLIVSVASLYWLFRLTNRLLNLGILAGIAAIVMTMVLAVSLNAGGQQRTLNVARDQFQRADRLRQAQSALFDARSYENQALIFRGNRPQYDPGWTAALQTMMAAYPASSGPEGWEDYETAHAEVVSLDESGKWEQARNSMLTGRNFTAFRTVKSNLAKQTQSVETTNLFPPFRPGRLRVLTGLGGLLAAVFAVAGFQRRLKEYR